MSKRISINEEAFLKLWRAGMLSRDIAKQLSVTDYVLRCWMKKYGCTSVCIDMRKKVIDDRHKLLKLGFTDQEIADTLGLELHEIIEWREANKLPENPEKSIIQKYASRFRWLYKQGYSDQAIADQFEVSITLVEKWRQLKGLPPQNRLLSSVRNEASEIRHRSHFDS